MATTRSKSTSGKNSSSKDINMDMISLSVVKELLNVQESSIKSFMSVYMDNTSQRLDKIIQTVQDFKTSLDLLKLSLKNLKSQVYQSVRNLLKRFLSQILRICNQN